MSIVTSSKDMFTTGSDGIMRKGFDVKLRFAVLVFVLVGAAALWLAGCSIEKTPLPQSGSISVTYSFGTNAVTGARISLDGHMTARTTPAVLTGVPTGTHDVGVFFPGYVDTSVSVLVSVNQTVEATLVATPAEGGNLTVQAAPDGTILLMNNVPIDTVPVEIESPTLFRNLGVGTFRFSAYLPGSATELPAQWSITLSPHVTSTLAPVFTPVPTGANEGDLAPVFELPSDWDSSMYRLQDYRGRVTLVTFFFYNCSACVEEFPYIAAMYRDPAYEGKIEFLGVDFADDYHTLANYREDHPSLGITFPLLHDRSQAVRQAYGILSCPANFIVDQTGRIRLIEQSIPEAELRQTVNQLLDIASAPTFGMRMRDTLITYTDGSVPHEFVGVISNLLNGPRSVSVTLTPVVCPDSTRRFSMCVGDQCVAPAFGPMQFNTTMNPLRSDTVKFDLYNEIDVWDSTYEIYLPEYKEFVGDYVLDVSATPSDNAAGRADFRLHLHDGRQGSLSRPVSPISANSSPARSD
jgi:peroxiredoxin